MRENKDNKENLIDMFCYIVILALLYFCLEHLICYCWHCHSSFSIHVFKQMIFALK